MYSTVPLSFRPFQGTGHTLDEGRKKETTATKMDLSENHLNLHARMGKITDWYVQSNPEDKADWSIVIKRGIRVFEYKFSEDPMKVWTEYEDDKLYADQHANKFKYRGHNWDQQQLLTTLRTVLSNNADSKYFRRYHFVQDVLKAYTRQENSYSVTPPTDAMSVYSFFATGSSARVDFAKFYGLEMAEDRISTKERDELIYNKYLFSENGEILCEAKRCEDGSHSIPDIEVGTVYEDRQTHEKFRKAMEG